MPHRRSGGGGHVDANGAFLDLSLGCSITYMALRYLNYCSTSVTYDIHLTAISGPSFTPPVQRNAHSTNLVNYTMIVWTRMSTCGHSAPAFCIIGVVEGGNGGGVFGGEGCVISGELPYACQRLFTSLAGWVV